MKICLNGRMTDKIPDFISGAGLFYGYGLFETVKITDKNPVFIKEIGRAHV